MFRNKYKMSEEEFEEKKRQKFEDLGRSLNILEKDLDFNKERKNKMDKEDIKEELTKNITVVLEGLEAVEEVLNENPKIEDSIGRLITRYVTLCKPAILTCLGIGDEVTAKKVTTTLELLDSLTADGRYTTAEALEILKIANGLR